MEERSESLLWNGPVCMGVGTCVCSAIQGGLELSTSKLEVTIIVDITVQLLQRSQQFFAPNLERLERLCTGNLTISFNNNKMSDNNKLL